MTVKNIVFMRDSRKNGILKSFSKVLPRQFCCMTSTGPIYTISTPKESYLLSMEINIYNGLIDFTVWIFDFGKTDVSDS